MAFKVTIVDKATGKPLAGTVRITDLQGNVQETQSVPATGAYFPDSYLGGNSVLTVSVIGYYSDQGLAYDAWVQFTLNRKPDTGKTLFIGAGLALAAVLAWQYLKKGKQIKLL